MGGSTKTETQTSDFGTTTKPFAEDMLKKAQGLYNQGVGFNPFPGSSVAPQSQGTQLGLQSGLQTAQQGNPLVGQAMDDTSRLLNNGGMSLQQRLASGFFGNQASGGMNLDTSGYNQFVQPSAAQGMLNETARGDYLNGSPYLDKMLNDQSAKVGQSVNEAISAAGRYGSGAHTKILTDQLASNRNNTMQQNYGQERTNQLNAITGLGNFDQQRLGALNNQLGMQQQNVSNMTTGANNFANLGQQGITNQQNSINQLPTINNARYADTNAALGYGAMQDSYSQQQLDDQIAKFNQTQQRPYDLLSQYGSYINPLVGMNKTQTASSSGGSNMMGMIPLLLGML